MQQKLEGPTWGHFYCNNVNGYVFHEFRSARTFSRRPLLVCSKPYFKKKNCTVQVISEVFRSDDQNIDISDEEEKI